MRLALDLQGVAPSMDVNTRCLFYGVQITVQVTKQDLGNGVISKFQVPACFTVQGNRGFQLEGVGPALVIS